MMRHKLARGVLTILLAAVAVFAVAEGILVLIGVRTPPVNYQGTLFADATVPMLLLAIVLGGGSLLAAATVFSRHAWGVFLAAAAGLIMIAWELIQIAAVQQSSSIFIYIGLAVIALAEYLWTAEFSGQQLAPTRHEVIRIALVGPVGSAWEYSNANYSLLGLIIEAASGESYADYTQDHIFTPLEMRHTYTSQAMAKQNGLAVGHRYWFAIPFAAPEMPLSHGSLPAGGLVSTSEDMVRYLIALLNGGRYGDVQILSGAGIEEL